MTTADLMHALATALEDADMTLLDADDNDVTIERVNTFAELDLITSADGLVLTLSTGERFQLSIAADR
jgi:hypothetical protein